MKCSYLFGLLKLHAKSERAIVYKIVKVIKNLGSGRKI